MTPVVRSASTSVKSFAAALMIRVMFDESDTITGPSAGSTTIALRPPFLSTSSNRSLTFTSSESVARREV